jgi:hypothetical protein
MRASKGNMGKVYEEIDATLSPKGLDTLRVLGPRTMAYLDYVGSGAETGFWFSLT